MSGKAQYEIPAGLKQAQGRFAEWLLEAARRREIDVALVWRLDRRGRSVKDLLGLVNSSRLYDTQHHLESCGFPEPGPIVHDVPRLPAKANGIRSISLFLLAQARLFLAFLLFHRQLD